MLFSLFHFQFLFCNYLDLFIYINGNLQEKFQCFCINDIISVNRFFERPDKEKQFLYQLLLNEENPDEAMENFRECLKRINSKEIYDHFLNSGFHVIIRDDKRTIEETLLLVEKTFKLK